MTIALDGHAQGTTDSGSTVSASLTTATANDLIIAIVEAGNNTGDGGPVGSVSFPGMQLSDASAKIPTWKLQYSFQISNGNTVQVWWGVATGTLSSDSITATFKDSQTRAVIVAFGVSGANTSKPFDNNSTIFPGSMFTRNGAGTFTTNAFSTSCTHAMLVTLATVDNQDAPNSPSTGFTVIERTTGSGNFTNMVVAQDVVAATQSSIQPGIGNLSRGSGAIIGFALAAAGETNCTNAPPCPMFEGCAQNATTSSGTTIAASVTTNQSNDVIVVTVGRSSNVNVSGIASTNTTGWTQYATFHQGTDVYVDIWYGQATGQLTNESITATFASSVSQSAIAIAPIVGASTNPFDTHAGLPVTNGSSGGTVTTGSFTTTNSAITALVCGGWAVRQPSLLKTEDFPPFNVASTNNAAGGNDLNVGMFAEYRSTAASSTSYTLKSTAGDWENGVTALVLQSFPSGTWASTEAADVMLFKAAPRGTWASTEADDTFHGAGYPQMIGSWHSTEADDTFTTVPFGLDGHATGGAHNSSTGVTIPSGTVTLTTSFKDDVIVLLVHCGGSNVRGTNGSVTSITDTAGLTWNKRDTGRRILGTLTNVEVWWAHAPNPLAADVITVHTSGVGFICLEAFGVSGANFTAPWDTHTAGASHLAENFGTGNPFVPIFTAAPSVFSFGFYASPDVPTDGTVGAPYTFLDSGSEAETNGTTGYFAFAYNVFNSQQTGAKQIQFGKSGGGVNTRDIMFDSIVGLGETGTAGVVRFFFDGPGNQTILALSGSTTSVSQSLTTYNEDTVGIVCVLSTTSLGSRVDHISDDANHSGWTRRSIATTDNGALALEVWWCNFPSAFSGNVTVHMDSNSQPGDIVGFIALGINGPSLATRGEIWDGDPSLPATNGLSNSGPAAYETVGPFSTINVDVLEVTIGGNLSTTEFNFNELPWLQFQGNNLNSATNSDVISGILQSSTPAFNIAMDFKFSEAKVVNDSATMNVSPKPVNWLMIADALPVGLPVPPTGSLAATEHKDTFNNSGAFTAIGLTTAGWVGYVPAHATWASTEAKDFFTNNGHFSPLFNNLGWIGFIPAFCTMNVTEVKDRILEEAWVFDNYCVGVWRSTEADDRMSASNRATVTGTWGSHETPDRGINGRGFVVPKALPVVPARRRNTILIV